LILAAGLLTGFWAVAIPVCWPYGARAGTEQAEYRANSR
jgi:hypothetical protein